MRYIIKNLFFLTSALACLGLNSCRFKQSQTESSWSGEMIRDSGNPTIQVQYAKRFRLKSINGFTVIEVSSPWPGSDDLFTYILRDHRNPNKMPDIPLSQVIEIPVKSIVCLSTTHLPYLEMIGEEDKLTGFPTTDYISSKIFRELVKQGKITELGPTNDLNIERLISLNPTLVMAFSMGNDLGVIDKIRKAGIPVVMNADYMENHPLGRAEWIKFVSLFFNRYQKADSIFNSIRDHYNNIRVKLMNVPVKPTVITGIVYGDTWFMPGGNNYASVFFRDAGARYLWEADSSEATLQLSFETVYDKSADVDFWVGTATYESKESLKNADSRYSEFKAFKNDKVYNYTARMGPTGGNEYFELGYARPDIVLADLASIFHPEILKDNSLYFYKKIE